MDTGIFVLCLTVDFEDGHRYQNGHRTGTLEAAERLARHGIGMPGAVYSVCRAYPIGRGGCSGAFSYGA
jgi:hypothetical protein